MLNYFEIILILIIVVLGVGGIWFYFKSKASASQGGLEEYHKKMRAKKQEYKDKIMDLVKQKGKISNKDMQSALGISEASVTRYAEELEKEGKLRQLGKAGRNVFYQQT